MARFKRKPLRFEPLESRDVPASFLVNTTQDLVHLTGSSLMSLREAIRLSNGTPYQENLISLPAGTYTLSRTGTDADNTPDVTRGDLDILPTGGNSIWIFGAGKDQTFIDAAGIDRIFDVQPGAKLLIFDATLQGGLASYGGAIHNRGQVGLGDSIVAGNTATSRGGAVDNNGGTFTAANTLFEGNFAGTSATSGGMGGAISHSGSGSMQIDDSVFRNNRTGSLGEGGAINSRSAYYVVQRNTFESNRSGLGGALATLGGNVFVVESTFTSNRAEFSGFTTAPMGGAILGRGEVYVDRSTFNLNEVIGGGRGGAIANSNSMQVVNSTISGNKAGATGAYGAGAGIYNSGGFMLIHSTITKNLSLGGGFGDGVFNNAAASAFTILNTIVAQNGGTPANNGPDTYGNFTSRGGNFIGLKAGSNGWIATDQVGITSSLNPRLGPLQNNGGPTATHALRLGSLAIDRGVNDIYVNNTGGVDQRGNPNVDPKTSPRVVNNVPDAGAYEMQPRTNDAPVAAEDAYSVNEDGTLNVAFADGTLANDTDADGDILDAVITSFPQWAAQFTFFSNGTFTYKTLTNYTGTDSFTYRAFDGAAYSEPVTVTITINPVNDAPTAKNDAYEVDEDGTLTVAANGVLGNDTDVDGDLLAAELVAGPARGTLDFQPDGSFVYTPDADFSGTDTFTYKAFDGTTLSAAAATVTLTVRPVNDAPVATQDLYFFTNEEQAVSGQLTAQDADGDVLTYSIAANPTWGYLSINTNGTFTYTPFNNFSSGDSFIFRVSDGQASDTARVVVVVAPVNDAPEAFNVTLTLDEDTELTDRYFSWRDLDGDDVTFRVLDNDNPGEFSYSPTVGNYNYRPPANFNGTVDFQYVANDGQLDSNVARVRFIVRPVNDAPTANSDSASVDEDTSLSGAVTGSDIDGDSLTFSVVDQPTHGSLTFNDDGTYTYTPNANYHGSDSFTFRANDGEADSNLARIDLTIRPVNDAPTANSGADFAIDEGTTTSFDGRGSSDLDGDSLTYSWDFGDGTTGSGATPTHAYPESGTYTVTLTVNDGTVSRSDSLTLTVRNVAPTASATGPAVAVPGQSVSFTFSANDPSPGDRAAGFTYVIAWGDGQSETVNGPAAGITLSHVYTGTGNRTVSATATDRDGGVSAAATGSIAIQTANLQGGTLFVGGTLNGDTIDIRPANASGVLAVTVNGTSAGTFTPTADIVVFAQAGADSVTIPTAKINKTNISVTRPVFLFGGDGNDTLAATGAAAGSVIVGGAGNDSLTGGSGRDILIGGAGGDTARGGDGEDILIGGFTDFDGDLAALRALRAEWVRTDANQTTRVNRLRGASGGLNQGFFLVPGTVDDDGVQDNLYGEGGTDWFFARKITVTDNLPDDKSNEVFTWI